MDKVEASDSTQKVDGELRLPCVAPARGMTLHHWVQMELDRLPGEPFFVAIRPSVLAPNIHFECQRVNGDPESLGIRRAEYFA